MALPSVRIDADEVNYGCPPSGIKGTGLKSGGNTPAEPDYLNATPPKPVIKPAEKGA